MPGQMPQPYEGNRPYIFACYAHADRDAVRPIIRALVDESYRVWWDDSIELAEDYPDYIADHLYGCACLVAFVSASSLGSGWCTREIQFALDFDKRVLPIYLEDVELTRGLHLLIGHKQALHWHALDSDTFYRRLFKARRLEPCLTDEGKQRRGVKPRDEEPGGAVPDVVADKNADGNTAYANSSASSPLAAGGGRSVIVSVGFEPKGSLADYSWPELKDLSWAIAKAGSDAEGLAIARSYHLADEDGRLQGDEKPLALRDGTKTSVRILGFRHDELASGGKSGVSFELADVPTTHRMNPEWTNEGGWEGSEMRGWLNGYFLGQLPDDLRTSVAPARKRTNNRGKAARNDARSVTATDDRLWLLSMSEVYGRLALQHDNVPPSPETYDAEGAQYKLYADKGVTIASYGFCAKSEASSWWWLRSPRAIDSVRFHFVNFDGDWRAYDADSACGVSPGFCL